MVLNLFLQKIFLFLWLDCLNPISSIFVKAFVLAWLCVWVELSIGSPPLRWKAMDILPNSLLPNWMHSSSDPFFEGRCDVVEGQTWGLHTNASFSRKLHKTDGRLHRFSYKSRISKIDLFPSFCSQKDSKTVNPWNDACGVCVTLVQV